MNLEVGPLGERTLPDLSLPSEIARALVIPSGVHQEELASGFASNGRVLLDDAVTLHGRDLSSRRRGSRSLLRAVFAICQSASSFG